ncbi:hypothetical protein VTH82DRAFT_2520 [Thermothelomyces myriococcoides]
MGFETSTTEIKPGSSQTQFEGMQLIKLKEVNFNDDLECVSVEVSDNSTRKMLAARKDKKQYLPGQPRIRLDQPTHNRDGNKDKLLEYLQKCHNTDGLDELLPFMRYIFVQTPAYTHIMPLHHQKSHAREIRVTESAGLHLVWYYELIFIKPIPAYFYSQPFWEYLQNADPKLYSACLGFMRSYYMLIQYSIDFDLACELRLIPPKSDGNRPTYEEWCDFIEPFSQVSDDAVNRRYHYGELRLTRINRAAVLFKFNLAYFHIYPQWGSFLEHTLAPIITIFAVLSVVLNSMQVSLAVIEIRQEGNETPSGAWSRFMDTSLWFPVVIMVSIAFILFVAVCGMGIMGVKDLARGNSVRRRKKKGDFNAGTRTHGMIW